MRTQRDAMLLTPRLNARGAQLRPLRYETAQMMLEPVLMRNVSGLFFFFYIRGYSAETCSDNFVGKVCTCSTNRRKINVQSFGKYKTAHPL